MPEIRAALVLNKVRIIEQSIFIESVQSMEEKSIAADSDRESRQVQKLYLPLV